jgi:hypothetical protein
LPSPGSAPASIVRKPRARITANQIPISYERVEVVNTFDHQSDSFTVHLPLFDQNAALDWTWWAAQPDIEIAVSVGFADEQGNLGALTQLIVGPVERVELVPLPEARAHSQFSDQGAYLAVTGGDYSRAFMNSPITTEELGQNLPSRQIMQNIAANHPQVTLDLSQAGSDVGTPYDQLTGRLFLHRSEWDVLTGLADHEGWRLRMDGTTLVVGPAAAPDAAQPYPIFYAPRTAGQVVQPTVLSLHLIHAKNIASGVDVIVEAHDAKSGTQARAKAHSMRAATTMAGRATYTFNHPGMTQAQAQQSAEAHADQIAKYEYSIDFMLPGDPTLTVERMIALSGTGTAFDQSYYITQIAHVLDMTLGYEMTVVAQNSLPGTGTTNSAIPTTAAPSAPAVEQESE